MVTSYMIGKKGIDSIGVVVGLILLLVLLAGVLAVWWGTPEKINDAVDATVSCEGYIEGTCINASSCPGGFIKIPGKHLCEYPEQSCCKARDDYNPSAGSPSQGVSQPDLLSTLLTRCRQGGSSCSAVENHFRTSANNGEKITFSNNRIDFSKNNNIIKVEMIFLPISVCEDPGNLVAKRPEPYTRPFSLEMEGGKIMATISPQSIPLAPSKKEFLSFLSYHI